MNIQTNKHLLFGVFIVSLMTLGGCSSNNVPAGSDASRMAVSTTPTSQLQADSAKHNQMKNYYRNQAIAAHKTAAP